MLDSCLLFAYFGPETVLPMTSVVATIVGLLMMFGRTALRLVFRWRRPARSFSKPAQVVRRPHYLAREAAQTLTEQH